MQKRANLLEQGEHQFFGVFTRHVGFEVGENFSGSGTVDFHQRCGAVFLDLVIIDGETTFDFIDDTRVVGLQGKQGFERLVSALRAVVSPRVLLGSQNGVERLRRRFFHLADDPDRVFVDDVFFHTQQRSKKAE